MGAPTIPNVGAGTTMVFATSLLSLEILSIDPGEVSQEEIDTTHLGTSLPSSGDANSRDMMFGKHRKMDGIDITFHWTPDVYSAVGVLQTITVTDPDGNTLSGTGGIASVKPPTYDPDGKLVGSAKVAVKGAWPFVET